MVRIRVMVRVSAAIGHERPTCNLTLALLDKSYIAIYRHDPYERPTCNPTLALLDKSYIAIYRHDP